MQNVMAENHRRPEKKRPVRAGRVFRYKRWVSDMRALPVLRRPANR